jgi:hypothetical protein
VAFYRTKRTVRCRLPGFPDPKHAREALGQRPERSKPWVLAISPAPEVFRGALS